MLLALFNCYFVPIQVSFEMEWLTTTSFVAINFIIDFLFFSDIMINFRTTYIDQGEEVYDPHKIAKNYISTTFIFDLAATIPFDFILMFNKTYQTYKKRT